VDAHLPPGLCKLLQEAGHDAIHTLDLTDGNRTTDRELSDISVRDRRVLVSKDADFYYSHVLHRRPWKLVLVRTGNIGSRELRNLFHRNLPAILGALSEHSLVELDRHEVKAMG
jgi:predicted nuclease of predicted toxin-antitoxin system